MQATAAGGGGEGRGGGEGGGSRACGYLCYCQSPANWAARATQYFHVVLQKHKIQSLLLSFNTFM